MAGRLQDSARPGNVASHVASDTQVSTFALDTSAPTSPGWRVEQQLQADQALFTAPFALIDADNGSPQRVSTLDEAHAAMTAGMAVAGQLHPAALAADVDPEDVSADPEAGEVAAEDLVRWAEDHGLPWALRASGRPGGHHVVVLAPSASTAAALTSDWTRVCRWVAAQHQVPASPRRTLRLLSSPHRLGLASPVLVTTLDVEDLPEPQAPPQDAVPKTSSGRQVRRPKRTARRASPSSNDRSRVEYGMALAHARAGWTARQAWHAIAKPGTKAAEQGQTNWRRWVWAPATTVVAAERGLSADQAWERFEHASPRRARALGRNGWQATYWDPAVIEAHRDRPRRHRTGSGRGPSEEQQQEISLVQNGLRSAAEAALAESSRRPQFRRSVRAALDALAPVLVTRDGSISERALCESACLARETLRRVLAWCVERDILERSRSYSGGAEHSAAWSSTPRVQARTDAWRKTETTRGVHPTSRTYGLADPHRLARAHSRQRREWALRCSLSAGTKSSEKTYKNSNHPAARALRSLRFQKRWWSSQSNDQQEHRRRQRRTELGQLHTSTRSQWFAWLAHRQEVTTAAARLDAGLPDDLHADPDWTTLGAAPRVLHRGMADPAWPQWHDSTGTTPPARQLELAA